ncbi:hypothetical protein [Niveispirillum irakense]|uniref:hypothetical protein n=1 Tax=Niveispirillum irakense TaxID=34011 RepID=UPI0003F8533B|nr:hypothetical protein [Niveispirillum irakense]
MLHLLGWVEGEAGRLVLAVTAIMICGLTGFIPLHRLATFRGLAVDPSAQAPPFRWWPSGRRGQYLLAGLAALVILLPGLAGLAVFQRQNSGRAADQMRQALEERLDQQAQAHAAALEAQRQSHEAAMADLRDKTRTADQMRAMEQRITDREQQEIIRAYGDRIQVLTADNAGLRQDDAVLRRQIAALLTLLTEHGIRPPLIEPPPARPPLADWQPPAAQAPLSGKGGQ